MQTDPPPNAEGEEPPAKPPEKQVKSEFDFSKVKPDEFMCFGTIEPDHSECKECPFREQCAEKAEGKQG